MGRQVVFLSGLICLCVTRCCPSRLCDNGKTNLVMDLPGPEELLCQELWPQSQLNVPDTDTNHIVEASDYICMDTPIKYNESLPTHGDYRPVEAESGEYIYCPPQRWLNNLKNGGLVFLYHPCVSAEARRSLAVLAHSCLSHYILTPHPWLSQHRPLAVVSWGRSLEMSQITLRVCDWLLSIFPNITLFSTSHGVKYNMYLTKPALHKPVNTSQEMSRVERLKSLKHCCMRILSLEHRTRKTRMALKQSPEDAELKENVKLTSTDSAKLNHTDTVPQNNTIQTAIQSHGSAKDSEEPERTATNHTKTTAQQLNIVTERQKYQTNRKSHKKTDSRKHRIKTDTKAQTSESECREFAQCGVPDSNHIEGSIRGERISIPRTDEAVWAAGAVGFILVLLTLSVLHTRLYRHCRPSTSLYWHDNQQDYDSVGDIIRRRLRKFGRRRKRSSLSRRPECPLLSNSSNDENSD